ncbi:MAG: ribosome silencing factor [Bacteroidia bacterium]|nr:ribosome silencing factor [Bacteroidia bacterium]
MQTAAQTVATALDAIRDKKGFNITILDLRHLPNMITDYLVICSGTSDTQTGAIADSVEHQLRLAGERPFRTEGKQRGEWILLDYINVVVHIFLPRVRDYYSLEELWGDAPAQHYAE